jgi:hypothetical protein
LAWPSNRGALWRRHIALPGEHGAWVFLLSPLLMGLCAGAASPDRTFSLPGTLLLIAASLAAFLLRQPLSIAVKAYSGRRSRDDLPAARVWILIYAVVGLAGVIGLAALGFGYVLVLAVPAVPVFAWHLLLISRRAERRQLLVEVVGSGVLALIAPAAYWVARGAAGPEPAGWWLAALAWLQSAASIVYAYLRLQQRALRQVPPVPERLRMAAPALAFTTANLAGVAALAAAGWLPALLPLAYAVQWLETVWGALRPAVGVKPTRIGLRQLAVSVLFTLVFILAWVASPPTAAAR